MQNVLSGQCLLAAAVAVMVKEAEGYLEKVEVTFALSFLALTGRPQAFIDAVHQEKNHAGEIYFAEVIS